jgi:hypothetical protein
VLLFAYHSLLRVTWQGRIKNSIDQLKKQKQKQREKSSCKATVVWIVFPHVPNQWIFTVDGWHFKPRTSFWVVPTSTVRIPESTDRLSLRVWQAEEGVEFNGSCLRRVDTTVIFMWTACLSYFIINLKKKKIQPGNNCLAVACHLIIIPHNGHDPFYHDPWTMARLSWSE